MTEQHPITPPPELVEQWRDLPEYTDGRRKMIMVTFSKEKLLDIATQAARWGADQELEACCEWLDFYAAASEARDLRAARRPKPLSLAEESLALIDKIQANKKMWQLDKLDVVRRALERLQELEQN